MEEKDKVAALRSIANHLMVMSSSFNFITDEVSDLASSDLELVKDFMQKFSACKMAFIEVRSEYYSIAQEHLNKTDK